MKNDYLEEANKLLNLKENLGNDELNEFYAVILRYIGNRISVETFKNDLEELNDFFRKLNYSYKEEIMVIRNWPSVIHANKNDLFYKYLVMEPIVNSNKETERDDILLNHGKDFMTSISLLYARIMYLSEHMDLLRDNCITRRKVLKITNEEFLNSYGISKDALVSMYPFNRDALESVLEWPGNVLIVKNLMEMGVARG